MAQLQFFFAYFFFAFALFRSSRLVSIEGDRRLEGSSAQHANVYLRSRRIHLRDIVVVMGLTTWDTYGRDVYVWSTGVRYIYLISINVSGCTGGYDIRYIFNFTHRRLLSLFHIFIGLERHVRFDSQFTLACIMSLSASPLPR